MDAIIPTVAWTGTAIRIIDQTKLPDAEQFLDLTSVDGVCEAIRSLRIRGAPPWG
jgi:methylthioribose-1-phosphate isomerase